MIYNLLHFYSSDGEKFTNHLKQRGVSSVIFENKEQYEVFIKFLETIINKPCDFIKTFNKGNSELAEKVIIYQDKDTVYSLHMYITETNFSHISLNIKEGKQENIDNYDERSYIYSFEKINGKMVLSEINAAG